MSPEPLVDQPARDRIRHALDDTMIVEAAAGTGKTSELVHRIVNVLADGRARVDRIVAVTFTEKAAGELKLRLRAGLERARAGVVAERSSLSPEPLAVSPSPQSPTSAKATVGKPAPSPQSPASTLFHLEHALAHLEEAHVSTIHGFCAELLRERPVEARIDPRFEVLTEADAERLYAQAFDLWLQTELEDPPEGVRRSLRRTSRFSRFADPDQGSGPTDRLRRAGWALCDWRDFPAEWTREPFDRRAVIDEMVAHLHAFADLAERAQNKKKDGLYFHTWPARQLSQDIRSAEKTGARDYDGVEAALVDLASDYRFKKDVRKGYGAEYAPGVTRASVLNAHAGLVDILEHFRNLADADLAALLQAELFGSIARYQALKDEEGRLDFVDLLVRARDLVRDRAEARADFQRRFTHLFVDEFQDTDPLQAELLLLLSADDPAVQDWRQVTPVRGKLFIVGDPKQSIYRFRRADVAVYQEVRDLLAARGARVEQLTTSFRSAPSIQRVVNAAFAPVMTGSRDTLQADYVPLAAWRPDPEGQPAIVALPVPEPYGRRRIAGTAIDKSLPDAVGAFIEWLVEKSGWTVTERRPEYGGPASALRASAGQAVSPESSLSPEPSAVSRVEARVPLAPRHICILFRRFDSWGRDVTRDYVAALEARGVPHLLVGGKTFHAREEVETMRAAIAAVEWPDDELSVFAAVRGSLFAVSDELLLEYRTRFGRLHPFRIPEEARGQRPEAGEEHTVTAPVSGPRPPTSESPVPRLRQGYGGQASPQSPHAASEAGRFAPIASVLALLADLHRRRNEVPVTETIGRLLAETRAHAGFVLRPSGEQALANVLQIAELARQYESAGGISFRGFVEKLREEAEEGETSEAPILEEGSDGVRLMTVHKAKGLEFPVVILADITAKLARTTASRYVDGERRLCALRLAGWAPLDLLEHEALEVERDRAEGVRLAYVAATRARDLLVVPAVGDEPYPVEGWVAPLNAAVYPASDRRRDAEPAPGCPTFGRDTVLERPDGDPATSLTVAPGLHELQGSAVRGQEAVGAGFSRPDHSPQRPTSAKATVGKPVPSPQSPAPSPDDPYAVAWWDPHVLDLGREGRYGLRQEDLIGKDAPADLVARDLAAYLAWRDARAAAVKSGKEPSLRVRTVTEFVTASPQAPALKPQSGPAADLSPQSQVPSPHDVTVLDVPRVAERPSGARFGALVHAVLALVALDAGAGAVREMAELQGRILGAPPDEIAAATEVVGVVLGHDILKRATAAAAAGRCRRESPLVVRAEDGTLLEGTVDLAFEEDGRWVVVDFKTDRELEEQLDAYRRQVRLYADVIARVTGAPADAILMRI